MSKKGGYVIVDLKGQSITAGTPFTLDGVTARLNRAKTKACLLSGFAIGDEEKRDVFVDLQKTEDGYVALFGQYTLTINDDEVTITDGGVLMENIVDSQGHKRFIEGNLTLVEKEGVTYTYNRWSLSGSHLLIVLALEVEASTPIDGYNCAFVYIPSWIKDKIIKIQGDLVDTKPNQPFTSSYTPQNENGRCTLIKNWNGDLVINFYAPNSNENKLAYRVTFDLLIDNVSE